LVIKEAGLNCKTFKKSIHRAISHQGKEVTLMEELELQGTQAIQAEASRIASKV
jgi:hypothetical protein